jgi:hypothetical protein
MYLESVSVVSPQNGFLFVGFAKEKKKAHFSLAVLSKDISKGTCGHF